MPLRRLRAVRAAAMLRDAINAMNPWRLKQRTVTRLLRELDEENPIVSQAAKKQLEAICYPNPFASGPRMMWANEYLRFVDRHARAFCASPVVLPLLAALDGDAHEARLFAMGALAANKEPQALPRIVAALEDSSPQIRANAAISLFHYRDPSTVDPLIALLADPEEEPRQFAAKTLGFIGDRRAAGPLLRLLESRAWGDRQSALYALGDMCDERELPAIRAALRDPSKRVRKAAKAALCDYDRRRRERAAERTK